MRSTPWPNDTLRTVNDARVPPRCSPITTPSKIWMRSLSPSRTRTCTRTVSPDRIAGRSASCVFSTSSIALIALPPSKLQNCRMAEWQEVKEERQTSIALPCVLPFLPSCHPAILQFSKHSPLFVIECGGFQQLRPPLERTRQRLPLAPPAD